MKKQKKGFTLIELLVVIGIISVLTGIVIIAVNPGRQLAQARNIQRRSDILTFLNAIHQYFIDQGRWPDGILDNARMIGSEGLEGCNIDCSAGDLGTIVNGCVNLGPALVPNYLTAIPHDPNFGNISLTRYAVKKDDDNRITVGACNVESPLNNLSVTR